MSTWSPGSSCYFGKLWILSVVAPGGGSSGSSKLRADPTSQSLLAGPLWSDESIQHAPAKQTPSCLLRHHRLKPSETVSPSELPSSSMFLLHVFITVM